MAHSTRILFPDVAPATDKLVVARGRAGLAASLGEDEVELVRAQALLREMFDLPHPSASHDPGMESDERERDRATSSFDLLSERRLARGEAAPPPWRTVQELQACSHDRALLVQDIRRHAFVEMLHLAWAGHRPIALSPDAIWLLVVQGVSAHVNAHAEALRSRFVRHTGRLTVRVERDLTRTGRPPEPIRYWEGVIEDLSAEVGRHAGPYHAALIRSFSTTTACQRTALQIAALDTVRSYFDLWLTEIICGIPEITLEGTAEDWDAVIAGLDGFEDLDLDWWLRPLREVLRRFPAAVRGDVDHDFWRSIFRAWAPERACSRDTGDGWYAMFFPYLEGEPGERRRNPLVTGDVRLQRELGDGRPGLVAAGLPTGISQVPFFRERVDPAGNPIAREPMELLSGFVGVAQDPERGTLRPEIGWAVRPAPEPGA